MLFTFRGGCRFSFMKKKQPVEDHITMQKENKRDTQ